MQELVKIVGATHEVVALILKEQLEMRKEIIKLRRETKEQFDCSRRETKEQLDRIEMLVRQSYSSH